MSIPSCCLVSHTLQQGVGPADANRLLASELARRGWRVSLCGLNDPTVPAVRAEEMNIYGTPLPTFRIPQTMGWDERCEAFRGFMEQQQPGFVIVRFIPYSLNPKGIVWKASGSLPKVLRGLAVIWLVDEIWLGDGDSTIKHRLVGLLQRQAILRLSGSLIPTASLRITTLIPPCFGIVESVLRRFVCLAIYRSRLTMEANGCSANSRKPASRLRGRRVKGG